MKKNILFNFFKGISEMDFDSNLPYYKKINVRLINLFCLVNIIELIIALIPITIFGSGYTVITLIFLFNFLVPVFFNYIKEYKVSKAYLVYSNLILIELFSFVFRRTGIHNFLFEFLCIVAFIMNNPRSVALYYFIIVASIIGYEYYDDTVPFVPMQDYNYDVFPILNIIIAATSVFIIIFYARRLNFRILTNLDITRAELKASREKVIHSNNLLLRANKKLGELLKVNSKELLAYKRAIDESIILSVIDKEGTIVEVNEPFCKASNYLRDEVIGKNYKGLSLEDNSEDFYVQQWKTISEGNIWRGDVKNKGKDNTYFSVDTVIIPMFDDNHKLEKFLSLGLDITEEFNAQETLNAQRKFYEQIFDNLPMEVIVYDKDLKYLYINQQAITNDELREWLIGKTDFDYCKYRNKTMELAERRLEYFKKAIEERKEVSFLDVLQDPKTPDKKKYILRKTFPYFEDDKLKYMIGFSTYVTDLVEAQEQLTIQRNFYQQVLDNVPMEIAIYDHDFKYAYVNKQSIKDDKLREWLIGKTDYEYCVYRNRNKEIAEKRMKNFQLAIKEKRTISFMEVTHDIITNKSIHMMRNTFPYFENGSLKYMIGFSSNVSEMMEAEQLKDNYIKTIEELAFLNSHKVRRPVASILGLMNVFDKNITPDDFSKLKEYLTTAAEELDGFTKEASDYISQRHVQINQGPNPN
jgi:PAS domain S-box-containing protein